MHLQISIPKASGVNGNLEWKKVQLDRHLVDDFLIQYCQRLRRKDFILQTEDLSGRRNLFKPFFIPCAQKTGAHRSGACFCVRANSLIILLYLFSIYFRQLVYTSHSYSTQFHFFLKLYTVSFFPTSPAS